MQLTSTNYLSLAEVIVRGYPLGIHNSDTDSDSDGMADAWELQYFGSLDRDGLGDFDNDGVIDRSEFTAGTHPALPSARYWRLVNVSVPGSYLEPAEVELYLADNTALNSTATISASDEPSVGLTQVVDGNLGTRGYWAAATAEAPGFYLQWDFGAGNKRAVAKLRQAGYDTADRFMDGFTLQYSDDGSNWTTQNVQSGLTYPGNSTYSVYYDVSQ